MRQVVLVYTCLQEKVFYLGLCFSSSSRSEAGESFCLLRQL